MSIVSVPRRVYRILKVVFVFAYSIVEVFIQRPKTRAARAAWLSKIGNRLCRAADVTYETRGPVPMSGAVISNHLTYVDILIHAAIRPGVFVSKIELRSTPVLGWISFMAGTIYVARGAGGSAAKAAEGMAKGFRDGLPVTFFPEGTTGVGDVPVLPMRSGLLSQAIAADVPVHYGFIRYSLTPRDLARGKTVRDDVDWGPETLWQHIWNFVDLHGVHGVVTFAPEPIAFSPAAIANRKVAALEAQAAMESLARSTDPNPVAVAS
ncbi:1-acyl-sn-glycerol-3-phosphate acyltransferase [Granulicella sp. 5B5]|uniref:lysophospholipid acyltransferase family protein n=1 Tax=Granulicella sp. 5B5 TaxID=1617967 RepID=UPI0015F6F1EE|nr:lysophospholipid acyltransferase family protein [Granulicella sp. 5B5]QMV18028.1 1-acyl-sn-glycerol-3-phosphate acyltransferase [Granulicella sp. 5B5]